MEWNTSLAGSKTIAGFTMLMGLGCTANFVKSLKQGTDRTRQLSGPGKLAQPFIRMSLLCLKLLPCTKKHWSRSEPARWSKYELVSERRCKAGRVTAHCCNRRNEMPLLAVQARDSAHNQL